RGAETIGFDGAARPRGSYQKGMERLGGKKYVDVIQGLRTGDSLHCKLAGCVNSFKVRTAKSGNKYAILEMSDDSSNFEGLVFSKGLAQYSDIIESQKPLLIQATIDKKDEESLPSIKIDTVELLDTAIAEAANGIEIYINNISAVSALKDILKKDRNGQNKIYILPEIPIWDTRICLSGGYGLYGDILSQIRSVPGISQIKEI
ncbi:MAG: hypothetical protein MJ210_04920, partial [Alphaproteobacteria bacterium]|nr:hypothetical protein [Alphaproteobacteria bacterium]